jgi:diguanylate cyclase (GGDEF)-like protein
LSVGSSLEGWSREDLIKEVERLRAQLAELERGADDRDASADLGDIPSRDALTGLFNRNAFFTLAVQQLRIANRFRHSLVLLACRVEGVDHIARVAGLPAANDAIATAARVTRETYRDADIVARVARDEFAVLAVQAARSSAGKLIGRLQDRLTGMRQEGQSPYELIMTVGQAQWDPDSPCSAHALLANASTDRLAQSA